METKIHSQKSVCGEYVEGKRCAYNPTIWCDDQACIIMPDAPEDEDGD